MSDSAAGQFPWLPGEGARLPDPAFTYRDDSEPPQHLMLALRLLAQGAAADGPAPPEWLVGIEADALNAPIRCFARERFGLLPIWNQARGAYDWYEAGDWKKADDGSQTAPAVPVAREAALERCWRGYAGLLQQELATAQETPAEALARIPVEWERWKQARAAAFAAGWRDAAAWPPALALSWIMFAGDWPRIAAYLRNGKDMPTSAIFLDAVFTGAEQDAPNLDVSKRMWTAMRSGAVVVYGVLGGQGASAPIAPADLLTLLWAIDPPDASAILKRSGLIYTNVLIDRATLEKAFPAAGAPAPARDMAALIREVAPACVPDGARASVRNEAIRKAICARQDGPKTLNPKWPSDTTIKQALRGTRYLKSRPRP
ncbi:MAG: hypothetical protein ABL864_00920 [Terricaulis sp.]